MSNNSSESTTTTQAATTTTQAPTTTTQAATTTTQAATTTTQAATTTTQAATTTTQAATTTTQPVPKMNTNDITMLYFYRNIDKSQALGITDYDVMKLNNYMLDLLENNEDKLRFRNNFKLVILGKFNLLDNMEYFEDMEVKSIIIDTIKYNIRLMMLNNNIVNKNLLDTIYIKISNRNSQSMLEMHTLSDSLSQPVNGNTLTISNYEGVLNLML
jgi:hypothetical protein